MTEEDICEVCGRDRDDCDDECRCEDCIERGVQRMEDMRDAYD